MNIYEPDLAHIKREMRRMPTTTDELPLAMVMAGYSLDDGQLWFHTAEGGCFEVSHAGLPVMLKMYSEVSK